MIRTAFSKPVSDHELPRLVRDFRAEGYAGLQLKGGQYAPYLDDPAGRLREWGEDPGIYSALIAFDSLDDAGLARLHRVVDFAVAVGGERVVFCHDHPRTGVDDRDRVRFAHLLSRVGASARDRGVALSLHHHHGQPVMERHDMDVFFEAVEPGTVGLTVDTAHLAKSGVSDIAGLVRDLAPVIDNIHLKDYDGQWQLLGQGDLDLTATVEQLRKDGYRGWLCADEESAADLTTGFRVSRAWLDEHLQPDAADPGR